VRRELIPAIFGRLRWSSAARYRTYMKAERRQVTVFLRCVEYRGLNSRQ